MVDQRSSGPFSFQQITLTGSGPLIYGIHEEPQTQIFYRFKSSYLHFAAMIDPSLFLVGSRYEWSRADIGEVADDRFAQVGQMALGFDYGAWSLSLMAVNQIEVGVKADFII